ncbi:MAG: hypothetical protein ACR2G7_11035 [Acidimicrobiales bacterium]
MNLEPSSSLPPRIDVPEVARAVEEWRRLDAEHVAASQRVFDLEEGRHLAVEADSEAYAVAIRSAKPDPGPAATVKADAALIEARRLAGALAKATSSAEADLLGVVERCRGKWLELLDRQADEAQKAYSAAVEAVEVSRHRLCDVRATTGWLRGFPGRPAYKPVSPGVAGLVARHGDRYSWPEVLAALRSDASPVLRPDAAPLVLRPPTAA